MKSILKKMMAYFLTFAMLIALVPLTAIPVSAELGGEGTETDPISISTLADLEAFRDNVNGGESYKDKYIKLTENIDMSVKYGKGKESWVPIGGIEDADYKPSIFEGTFDGNGYTVSGLYIESNNEYQGLFGYVERNGTVKNLNISGEVIVENNNNVGLVAGYNLGTISNVRASGAVDGTNNVGLIAGKNGADTYYLGDTKAKIENSHADGTVNGYDKVGLVAGLNKSLISKCSSSGTFSLDNSSSICSAGGICGENSDDKAMVEYSYNAARYADKTNNNKQVRVGGISGRNYGAKISYCYNTAYLEAYNVGGIACYNETGTITQCYQYASISVTLKVYGEKNPITKKSTYGKVESSYYDDYYNNGEYPDDAGTVLGGLGSGYQDELVGWDFENVWKMDAILNRPFLRNNLERGSADKPHEITGYDTLQKLSNAVNNGNTYEGEYIKLTTDIRYEYKRLRKWTPIGTYDAENESNSKPFKGNFDGEGHLIFEWGINAPDSDYQGLFGYTDSATIKNLSVSGEVACRNYVGMIVGYSKNSTIENVSAQGSVKGKQYVSGIVGKIETGTLQNVQNRAPVSAEEYVGGIVGHSGGRVYENFNAAEINGNDVVGGIVGLSDGDGPTISDSYNIGGITATGTGSVSGGICGKMNDTSVSNVYNIGAVSSLDGETTHGAIYGKQNRCYVSSAYYLKDTVLVVGGIGKTAEEFKNRETFENFNFDNTWAMNPYLGRPVLRSCKEYAGGTEDGTEENPYTINNLDDLEVFRDSVNGGETYEGKYVKLTADIDLSEKCGADINGQEVNWAAIGDYNSKKTFSGSFDGDNHKITGMYIKSYGYGKALFGYLGKSGTVKNLTVSGEITEASGSGIVVANNRGTIKNVSAAGSVSASQYIGGICGENYGTIENSSNEVTVTADAGPVGGICAYNSGSVKNCYNTGSVTGNEDVGGICGYSYNGKTIQNCYNAAPVTSNSEKAGGICGLNGGSIDNCYNVGSVTAANNIAGGICGGTIGEISNCYNYASVTSNGKKAGICASTYPPNPPKNNYYNGDAFDGTNYNRDDNTGDPVYDGKLSQSEFADQTKFSGFDFENTWVMNKSAERPMLKGMEEPDGSKYNPLKIRTLADLEKFSESVNGGNDYAGKKVLLLADIDMSEKYGKGKKSWTPIGHYFDRYDLSTWFNGTFEGNGHKITGLYIQSDAEDQGLFGTVNASGTIRNLTVSGNVSGENSVGLLVGWNIGVIENVTVYGSANGSRLVGGIVGYNDTSESYIKQCTNYAAISGEDRVGGIVGGAARSTVQECRNMGTIYASNYYAGGIAGEYGTIQNCYNTAPVSADNYGAGGIAGYGDKIQNCYNIAPVSAGEKAGGIAGSHGSTENCYNIGGVSADKNAGGIVGYDGTAENCYHTTDADNGIGTAITEAKLADKNTFAAWDFETVWRMNPLIGRPALNSNREGESGTESDPYIIDSLAKLEKFRDSVNNGLSCEDEFVKLEKDIDLSEKYNANNNWTPIGIKGTSGNPDKPFSGTFDGNGHTISGLYINDTSKTYQGLFGTVSGGVIKKLGVTEAQVVANRYFAGIAAYMTGGTIENCYYSGKLGANEGVNGYYGAIAGEIENESALKNCYANAEIPDYSPSGNGWSAGVIAGSVYYNSQVISCYFLDYDAGRRPAVGVAYSSSVENTSGKTAAELAEQSTYVGWDFENVWTMHPILRLPTFASGGFSGTGTEQEPYIINTLEDLEILASAVNSGNDFESTYFALDSDIDMKGKYSAETGKSWTPIGETTKFLGSFDGRNHTINGLYINTTNEKAALFGYLAYGSEVKNLTVCGTIENGGRNTGALAGINDSGALIENCAANVDITASESYIVGGLVGYNYGIIKDSYATGNISGKGTVGGLVGCISGATIQNCYSSGSVTGEENVGGIIGYSEGGTAVNCYSIAEVTSGKPLFGSGWYNAVNCYYKGDTDDTSSEAVRKTIAQFASGEVAYLLSKGCSLDGTVYDGSVWKQTIGKDDYPNFTGKTVSCTAGCPSYNNDGDTSERPHTFNDDGTCSICGRYKGAELVNGVYQINNKLDLIWFAEHVNSGATTANATVTSDIYLNDKVLDDDGNLLDGLESFTPIGTLDNPYGGTFDGNRRIIGGIYINNSDLEYAGLFGVTAESAVIKNVIINKSYVAANKYVGMLVGQNNGTVERCMVGESGIVSSGGAFIGGVCGDNNGKIIGDVNLPLFHGKLIGGGQYMGGICGRNGGSVTNAINFGTIDTSGSRVGGIVGVNDYTDDEGAVITDSANYGSVTGNNIVGGICGENYAIIKSCTNAYGIFNAYVIAQTYAGGICGKNNGSISQCVNNEQATISSNEEYSWYCYAGGIAASNGEEDSSSISDCINLSSQISGRTVGGIVGLNGRNGNMQYCINTAESGGVVGVRWSDESAIVNCYYMESSELYEFGTAATVEQFGNGFVLEKLRDNRSETIWVQNIGTDPFPKLGSSEEESYSIEISGNDVVFCAPKGTYTAVLAAYDENGKLINTVTKNLTVGNSGKESLSLSDYPSLNGATVKVMLWDSLESMRALCKAVEIVTKASVTATGGEIHISAPKGTYTVVLAAYDESEKLINTVSDKLTFEESGKKNLYLNDYPGVNGATVKVMLWDSLDSMRALCKAAEIN